MPLAPALPHQIRSLQQALPAMPARCASQGAWQLRRVQRGAPLGRAPRGRLTLDLAVCQRRASPGRREAASRRTRLGRQYTNQVLPTWVQQLRVWWALTHMSAQCVFFFL